MLDYSDPDIKITATKGKSFVVSDSMTSLLIASEEIKAFANVVEERAFLQYKQRDQIAYVKGVSDNYMSITKNRFYFTYWSVVRSRIYKYRCYWFWNF